MPRGNTTPVNCPICDKAISCSSNLSSHVRTHDKDNDAFMHACPFPDCTYKALRRTNLQTHINTHTGERPHRCPECPFTTGNPSYLTHHRKKQHGYQPMARRYPTDSAAPQSAAAPYLPTQNEGDISASVDLNRGAPSRAEFSHSGNPEFQDEFGELTWERLFPPEEFARFDEQRGAWVPYPTPFPNPNRPF
ncbi:hypothetical protein P692DRAFT_20839665 [Suillus brevipes Sb2]|nr:hypothetical protein P692DRAFT_20839665 [Suillus brevipes Sb2]